MQLQNIVYQVCLNDSASVFLCVYFIQVKIKLSLIKLVRLHFTYFPSPSATGGPPGFVDKTESIFVSQYGGLELVGEAARERPGTLHRRGESLADSAVHLPYPGAGGCR